MSLSASRNLNPNYKETLGGKDITPPLIPSTTETVYTSPGVYNLRGFYNDLNLRILEQREIIKRIHENSSRGLDATNLSYVSGSVL